MQIRGYRLEEPLRAGADSARVGPAPPAAGQPAQVWSGRRESDDQPVALKLFHPADAGRATREAALTAAVDHPHVLPVLELVTGPQAIALVMPLATGGSLAELVAARRRLRWPEVLTVLIPLADALAAAHERDVVHGDLSAGNVLFDDAGRPLLADLGAARAAGEVGVEVAVTPTDVAPEIARGASPGPATDVFSLGSLALLCLSGRPAWPAENLQDVLVQSAAGQWPDPGDLLGPPGLLAIVRRLLDAEPTRRGSAARAAVELRRVGDPEPVRLIARDRDGTVTGPTPATMVRADAVRPPGAQGPGPTRRRRSVRGAARGATAGVARGATRGATPGAAGPPAGRHQYRHPLTRVGAARVRGRSWLREPEPAGRPRSERLGPVRHRRFGGPSGTGRPRWHTVVAVAGVLLLGVGAVRAGLWWSQWGDAGPTRVTALPAAGQGPATRGLASPAATGVLPSAHSTPLAATPLAPARPAPSPSIPSASAPVTPAEPGQAGADTAPDTASDAEWLAVVSRLDAARAAALAARDPRLLDAVYTPGSPARAADERAISAMTGAGYRVAVAGHDVRSASLVEIGAGGSVTVLVTESLPSYQVLDERGTVVGTTAATAESAVLLGLRPTGDGFRIEQVRRG